MTYDPAANGIGCHRIGFAALRELRVRLRQSKPIEGNEREERWAKEGVPYDWIDMKRLDTVREGGSAYDEG